MTFAFLGLFASIIVLAFMLARLSRKIDFIHEDRVEDDEHAFSYLRGIHQNAEDTNINLAEIKAKLDALNNRTGLHSTALLAVVETLSRGVKTIDRVETIFNVYWVELLFYDGETATGFVSTHEQVGIDDDIEILCDEDEDDAPGLTVTFSQECLVRHPRHGLTELTIPVEDDIDLFRDRLIGDGWTITSPEADDEEEDDEVLSDPVEAVDPGL